VSGATETPFDLRRAGAEEKAHVLAEAMPYIREFSGKTVVIKYGGHAMESAELADQWAQDVVLMRLVGMNPVVVHGGGPQITELMKRLGKTATFVDGLRVTDAETVDIARMALVGKVNREVVASLNQHGSYAVGLSGEDAGLIAVTQRDERLGFVGDVEAIDPSILHRLLREELIPVVATIGMDDTGQAYNVNADTVAGAIAEALGAEKLVYLTDVAGVYRDYPDEGSLIAQKASSMSRRISSFCASSKQSPLKVFEHSRRLKQTALNIVSENFRLISFSLASRYA